MVTHVDADGTASAPGTEPDTVLERDECLTLLTTTGVGRLAVALGEGAPVLRPVNYAFDPRSQSIVFRTGEGSKLHALLSTARDAAFEVDDYDPHSRTAWSVIVVGVAHEVTAPAETARLDRFGLEPYSPGGKHHWIQLRVRTVSGRRVGVA